MIGFTKRGEPYTDVDLDAVLAGKLHADADRLAATAELWRRRCAEADREYVVALDAVHAHYEAQNKNGVSQ